MARHRHLTRQRSTGLGTFTACAVPHSRTCCRVRVTVMAAAQHPRAALEY